MMRRAIECKTWVFMSHRFTQSVLLENELTLEYLKVVEPCLHFEIQTVCDARQEFPAAIYSDIGLGLEVTSSARVA